MHVPELDSVEQLPRHMAQARIALGWSQRMLAEECGMQRLQIWRYEKDDYRCATLETVIKISRTLARGLREKKDGRDRLQEWLDNRRAAR